MTEKPVKKFSLFSAVLMVICVVFVAEAAPVVASMGNSQYIWWGLMIVFFLIPYGLISSELSTAFPDEGGLYDWVKRAYGKKWGTRVSWYYWINFPFWIGSLAVLFPLIINFLLAPDGGDPLGMIGQIAVGLAFIWIVVLVSLFKISDSAWILNLGAVLKVGLAVLLFVLGIMAFVKNGYVGATEFTLKSFAPFSELSFPGIVAGLGALTILLFNFMGFEVMSSMSSEMKNPQKQLPTAIIAGGLVIAAIYIISSFGIGVAIPAGDVAADLGIVDAVYFMVGADAFWLVVLAGILFLTTLFGNMLSWSYGVNYVASYGAMNGDMPAIFGKMRKGGEMPLGAPIVNGIVASVILLVGVILPYISATADAMFWSFFSLSIITLLMSYVPMFPAWLKLRKTHADIERPYSVPGGRALNKLFATIPVIILLVTLLLSLFPVPSNEVTDEDVAAYAAIVMEDGITEEDAIFIAESKGLGESAVAGILSDAEQNGVSKVDADILAYEFAVGTGPLTWTAGDVVGVLPTIIGVIFAVIAGEVIVRVLAGKRGEQAA